MIEPSKQKIIKHNQQCTTQLKHQIQISHNKGETQILFFPYQPLHDQTSAIIDFLPNAERGPKPNIEKEKNPTRVYGIPHISPIMVSTS